MRGAPVLQAIFAESKFQENPGNAYFLECVGPLGLGDKRPTRPLGVGSQSRVPTTILTSQSRVPLVP